MIDKVLKEKKFLLLLNIMTPKFCDDILGIISEQSDVEGNIFDITEAYMNYKNKHLEVIKENMTVNLMIIEI